VDDYEEDEPTLPVFKPRSKVNLSKSGGDGKDPDGL